jgi:preprotein translocase SecE subunit
MAEKSVTPAKKRQLKKVETVRQRVERAGSDQAGKRRVSGAASKVGRPLKAAGRFIAKVLRPFAFIIKPFKTRPARFVGRLLASILLLRYIRNSWTELRQVQWPDMRTTLRLSMAVFVFSILFGVLVAVTDYGLDKVFRKVFID